MRKPTIGKEYFNHLNLEAIVRNYPYRKNLPKEDIIKENQIRMALIDFLRGLVEFDPAKRWSPFQASRHPFVTGEPFTCPYQPPPETPRVKMYIGVLVLPDLPTTMPTITQINTARTLLLLAPYLVGIREIYKKEVDLVLHSVCQLVSQNVKVNHHPGGGHWFAAGLSPNIAGWSKVPQHSSPSFQAVPHAHAGSYGSLGSHGSYNDGAGLGSSYGSYGDGGNMFAYYSPVGPSAMNLNAQGSGKILGSSPDTRRRMIQFSHGSGLGVSPSGGNFAPLPLGTSPSQFTPPGSYSQFSVGSPGHYGPPSPARGSIQGSPLGKTSAMSQMNRRKGWGYSGSSQVQEGSSSLHWQGQGQGQGHLMEGSNSSQAEDNSHTLNGSQHLHAHSTAVSWKQQPGGTGLPAGFPVNANMSGSLRHGSSWQSYQAVGAVSNVAETDSSLPDPGDWDPNYSDELLLQEDGSDTSLAAEFGKVMHLSSTESLGGVGRTNHVSRAGYSVSTQRQLGPVQAYPHGEVGKLPSHDQHSGHIRAMSKPSHFTPQYPYNNSLSRLGQQPAQRFNHGRSTSSTFGRGGDWHITLQAPNSSFGSEGPHSPGSGGSFINGMPWGG
ncbi:hypothetical protein CRG98_025094 [Punica granatum]|uniref:Protein kinase domain-containing protein n=1 Tax=Punica granatum TaxID=22663 RepID=A0A2I0JF88_PUNGR|nr:hypothetical protein CRG98_025094 [Punica granatum]